MLDQNTNKTLKRAQNSTVQHHWCFTFAIFIDELGTKTSWQHKVELQGTALPYTADTVAQGEFDLRTVEGTFAWLQLPLQTRFIQRIFQCRFGQIPLGIITDTAFRTGRQLHFHRVETEVFVHIQRQLDEIRGFLTDLLLSSEDVRVILGEATHTHNAVQRT